ncbi:MAG: hypothetical protein P4L71_14735 [Acetobacteraceae bacterium]|nr:hypothetical protein [Acetobacteraceae bacterium]
MPVLIALLILRPATPIPSPAPGDYVHYFLFRQDYQARIDAEADAPPPRLLWFFWRDASPVFGQTLVYLVFDESDGFARSDDERSEDWKTRARTTYLDQQRMIAPARMPDRIRHLFGHFYVVYLDG